ncbi:hypothetical protein M8C21_008707, partial [Ambrosia artemisiifolia]
VANIGTMNRSRESPTPRLQPRPDSSQSHIRAQLSFYPDFVSVHRLASLIRSILSSEMTITISIEDVRTEGGRYIEVDAKLIITQILSVEKARDKEEND